MAGQAHYGLAIAAGTVAAVNPCGFAMLPAYLSLFVGTADGSGSRLDAMRRAFAATTAMTAGFVAVFAVFAFLIQGLSVVLEPAWLAWATIVIGIGLTVLGVVMLIGRDVLVVLPKVSFGRPGRSAVSMGLYGMTYAVASLSCTIGPFLTYTTLAFRSASAVEGLGVVLAYCAGMGLVVGALSVGAALARTSVANQIRRAQRYLGRISGGLLVVAGGYVTWYGWFDLRVIQGGRTSDPLVDRALRIQGGIARWIGEIGAWWLLVALVALTALGFAPVLRRRAAKAAAAGPGTEH